MSRGNGTSCLDGRATGMAFSVLSEIGTLLETLAQSGEEGAIDLRSLPLTEADRSQLEELLGSGEVLVELNLSGGSEVWETAYPGTWWIRHRGAGGKISSEEIAICRIPEILVTHPADIEAAAVQLRRELIAMTDAARGEQCPGQLETTHE